jgi:hypothetical protein
VAVAIRLLAIAGEKGSRVSLDQKSPRVFGVLYLITFATSITAALLYRLTACSPHHPLMGRARSLVGQFDLCFGMLVSPSADDEAQLFRLLLAE